MLYGMVYCFVCGDYIYDNELDKIAKQMCQRPALGNLLYNF